MALQNVVEQLCENGCQQVNAHIRAIEAGHPPQAMLDLTEREQLQVLGELKSIMAVYERCDL